MAKEALTYEEGKKVIAYIITVGAGEGKKGWMIRQTQYNCYGEVIVGQDNILRQVGKEGIKLGLDDRLTLENMARGCCPPRLMKKYIQKEADPVIEAMNLHKRGYFGGGG